MGTSRVARTAELAAGLRPALLRLTRLLRQNRADDSVSLGQLAALGTVNFHGPMSAGELAERELVRPPSMTKIVAALEGRGLVSRAPHPTDGRQVVIAVTAAGRELVESTRRARTQWLVQQLSGLTPDELAVLADAVPILDKLAQQE